MDYPIEGRYPTGTLPQHLDNQLPNQETRKKIFYIDVHQLQTKPQSKLSSIFSQIDSYLILKNQDRRDHLKHYRDMPLPLNQLYNNSDYVKQRHGHDIQVRLDTTVQNRKKRRQITMVKDSFSQDEENVFQRLHAAFTQIAHEVSNGSIKGYGSKSISIFEITDIYMRVSGDLQAVRDYLQGKRVVEWQYLEDIALSHPENSTEYRCLLTTKGREEVEKRKRFLLSTQSVGGNSANTVNANNSISRNNTGGDQEMRDESKMEVN